MNDIYSIVFPGQGSQRPGMGSDFYEKYPEAKDAFVRASGALGEDISAICFSEDPKLDLTEFTQPCILTCSIAMFDAMRKATPFQTDLFAGHSLGEYTALVAAGALPLETAVKIVRRRGALMQKVVPVGDGAMAALIAENLDQTGFRALVATAGADIANINSTSQTVISGSKAAVERAAAEIRSQLPQVDVVFLNVSAPFHSSLMKSIEGEFREYLMGFAGDFVLQNATRVASNFSGKLHDKANLFDNLVAQISGSVRWTDNMQLLAASGHPALEIGPNKPLNKFLSSAGIPVTSVINLRSLKPLLPN